MKIMIRYFMVFAMMAGSAEVWGQGSFYKTITSLSGKVALTVHLQENKLAYELRFRGEKVLRPSRLGMIWQGGDTIMDFSLISAKESSYNETWSPVWGQNSSINNRYNECVFHLKDLRKERLLDLCFRVYDDGVAFRYGFPESIPSIVIMSEETQFSFADNFDCWWIWADYNTLEKLYQKTPLKQAPHVAAPFTMRTKSGTHLSIYEAAIGDYSTMTLKQQSGDSLNFKSNLVPWADGSAVKTRAPFNTPWRVIQLSETAGGLMESSLILNLNEPSVIKDASWIQPMTYIGIWWEMHLGLSTWSMEGGRHGATTANAKRYIDFAAAHGIHGVLFEGWNTGWEQWGNPGAFDNITPYADFAIKEVVDYARSKGVEIIGHHETGGDIISYDQRLDSAFAYYQRLGIRVVKTGYAGPVNPPTENHHGQYMVRHFNKVMETAAKYQIMLDVHEPVIPSGLSRTYPNLMSFEGVRGMEWNAWSEGNPPEHTCILPFTRGLAGPMDYTPGIFDIKEDSFASNRVKWHRLDQGNNAVHSTLSNQLALMVILYSPLQMASDLIENYEGHPAFEIISTFPTTWDETRVLAASIGEYVVVARRKGTSWYIAGITNEKARVLNIPMDFLDHTKKYSLLSCTDAATSHFENNPETYSLKKESFTPGAIFTVRMAAGGGGVFVVGEER